MPSPQAVVRTQGDEAQRGSGCDLMTTPGSCEDSREVDPKCSG